MKAKITAIFLVIGLFAGIWVNSPVAGENLLEEANNAFNNRNYTQAVLLYENIIAENGYSSELLYNLGNAYSQLGNIGQALACYRKAELLVFHDPDISRNIVLVKKHAGLFDEENSFWQDMVLLLTCNQWFLLLFCSFAATVSLFTLRLLLRHRIRTISFFVPGCFLVITCVLLLFSINSYRLLPHGIVLSDTVLFLSPYDGSDKQRNMKEGQEIRIQQKYGEFYQISERNGGTGWVKKELVGKIRE